MVIILEAYALTALRSLLSNHIQALIQESPLVSHEERVPLCQALLWNRMWQSYTASPILKISTHCEFSTVNSSQISISKPSTNPLFQSLVISCITLKKSLLIGLSASSLVLNFSYLRSQNDLYNILLWTYHFPAYNPTMAALHQNKSLSLFWNAWHLILVYQHFHLWFTSFYWNWCAEKKIEDILGF